MIISYRKITTLVNVYKFNFWNTYISLIQRGIRIKLGSLVIYVSIIISFSIYYLIFSSSKRRESRIYKSRNVLSIIYDKIYRTIIRPLWKYINGMIYVKRQFISIKIY
nr:MAG TPA: hypothetical protein [Bacteriophage sp.]